MGERKIGIEAWGALNNRRQELHAQLRQIDDDIEDFEITWRHKYPLTDGQLGLVSQLIMSGVTLCCHAGLEQLKQHFDPLWAEFLNHWAYESLGCSDYWTSDDGKREAIIKLARVAKDWKDEWTNRKQQH